MFLSDEGGSSTYRIDSDCREWPKEIRRKRKWIEILLGTSESDAERENVNEKKSDLKKCFKNNCISIT